MIITSCCSCFLGSSLSLSPSRSSAEDFLATSPKRARSRTHNSPGLPPAISVGFPPPPPFSFSSPSLPLHCWGGVEREKEREREKIPSSRLPPPSLSCWRDRAVYTGAGTDARGSDFISVFFCFYAQGNSAREDEESRSEQRKTVEVICFFNGKPQTHEERALLRRASCATTRKAPKDSRTSLDSYPYSGINEAAAGSRAARRTWDAFLLLPPPPAPRWQGGICWGAIFKSLSLCMRCVWLQSVPPSHVTEPCVLEERGAEKRAGRVRPRAHFFTFSL